MTEAALSNKRRRKELRRRVVRHGKRQARFALHTFHLRYDRRTYDEKRDAERAAQQTEQKRVAVAVAIAERKSSGPSVLRRVWNRVTGAK